MILEFKEVSMMGRRLSSHVPAMLLFAVTCVASALPAQRIVDLGLAEMLKLT